MNINKSNLVVYPSAGSSEREYKLNSEKNLAGISNKLVRNKIIEGLEVSSNVVSGVPGLIINQGIASINGYGIRITSNIEFSNISGMVEVANSYYLVIFKLVRASNGNLKGMDLNGNYLGLEVDIISDSSPDYSDKDMLIVGTVIKNGSTYTAQSYKKSRATLRAQDIFVEGARVTDTGSVESDQQVTSGSNGNYTAAYLNPSATLDEFLANMIISDGQFN